MLSSLILLGALAVPGRCQIPVVVSTDAAAGHRESPMSESAEDKARTAPGGASKGVKACHADIERWCKEVKPGEGRLGACLKPHAKELSKPCRRWASHGGKAHVDAALLRDLDGAAPAPAAAPK